MSQKFNLTNKQKKAADALGIKKVNKQKEVNAINAYIASQKAAPVYQGGGASGSGSGDIEGAYPWDKYSALQENLATINANAAVSSAGISANATVNATTIKSEADKEIAKAYTDAQKYASELGLEGVKYGADKQSEWQQAVANIEVKGKLDLQPIINAGLEKVAGIQSEAQKSVAETTGKYGLASTKEQTASAEKLGKMQLAGSLYGLLGSMFG